MAELIIIIVAISMYTYLRRERRYWDLQDKYIEDQLYDNK